VYSKRIRPELGIALVQRCNKKDAKVVSGSKEFIQWASEHSEIVF
jgi:hypothetical protein